jgi:hypothetical protein
MEKKVSRGASGDANRNRKGGKKQYHPKCHEKIFQRNFEKPLDNQRRVCYTVSVPKGTGMSLKARYPPRPDGNK